MKRLVKILIVVAIIFAIVGTSAIFGGIKKYDDAEIEAEFALLKGNYPEIDKVQKSCDEKTAEIQKLESEIEELQSKYDEISEFEANRENTDAELAELEYRVEALSAQKSSLEQSVIELDTELANY